MTAIEQYIHDRDEQVRRNLKDRDLQVNTERFTEELVRTNYTKNFTYMGVPILQYPTDLMVMQEIIWDICPDYIIETGVAFGGMTLFYASVLEILGGGSVIGIDIEVRPHARKVERDWVFHETDMRIIEGSSIDPSVLGKEKEYMKGKDVLVSLDSNHTHEHVIQELRLYAPLVSVGSYIIVFDTAIEYFGHLDKNQDRPWKKGNNPATAVKAFLQECDDFVVDREVEQRAGVTAAPGGWLRRIR